MQIVICLMSNALENFDERARGIVATVLLMKTGLMVAARIRANVDETFLSTSLARLVNGIFDLSDKLFSLTLGRIISDNKAGTLILGGVNADMVFVAIFKKRHLGAILLLFELAAKHLSRLFQSTLHALRK